MILWIDAQLSPAIARWLTDNFPVRALALRERGLRDATDREIVAAARQPRPAVMTKDSDFVELVVRVGPPPQVVWLTCGNTSNDRLKQILSAMLPRAIDLLQAGEPLVEINVG